MSKKMFSEKEQKNLSTNKYVIHISDKAITYADEFKQLFIDQYMAGKTPREIFEANGFDVNIIGVERLKACVKRWKKAYAEDGVIGLADSRKGSSGRPLKRELTQDEVIARQEARIRLLESQVELLKKLDTKERLLVPKGKNLSKSNLFELIKETVGQGLGRTTSYLCD
ncbi:HTH domain-containing protein, partial [Paenibacillus ferrarius]